MAWLPAKDAIHQSSTTVSREPRAELIRRKSKIAKEVHMRLFVAFSAIVLIAAACGCKKAPPPKPPAPVAKISVTTGILDYSKWAKWVQTTPNVILVSTIDTPTTQLIGTQVRIFTTLVSPPEETLATAGDVQSQLDAVKNSFPAKQQTYAYSLGSGYSTNTKIDIPHQDRWDAYRRTVLHANLTNLPSIISQLDQKIQNDLQDLDPQLRSSGVVGAQARADSQWLNGQMAKLLGRMKQVGKASFVSPLSPVEKAREEWLQFENTDLPLLKQVLESKTVSEAPVDSTGRFEIKGQGTVVAVVTVAGRQLYFPVSNSGALRFFNIETTAKPVSP